jgi:hypothetical protein
VIFRSQKQETKWYIVCHATQLRTCRCVCVWVGVGVLCMYVFVCVHVRVLCERKVEGKGG